MPLKTTISLSVLIFCILPLIGCASAGFSGSGGGETTGSLPMAATPVIFFQRYLSRADGHRCPMTPSCSSYALEAMRRHGALMGYIMACDRLMRCGRDELDRSPSIMTRDGLRCQDPLSGNDFWWR